MGCINSTKKISELKCKTDRNENIYRVRVIRLLNDSSAIRCGFLELTPKELIFSSQDKDPIVWSLQHLRRYGMNDDVFSFEAGRRCMTGPGIYVFRCQQAESLYKLFQTHVNAMSNMDDHFAEATINPHSHQELNQYTNNYLEPAPLSANVLRASGIESYSMSSLEMNIDSPTSVPSLSFTNEIIQFPNQVVNLNPNSNIYQEYQLKQNNNKVLLKGTSMDLPPENKAPNHSRDKDMTNSLHMYENIAARTRNFGKGFVSSNNIELKSIERCYENFSRIDLPLLLEFPKDPHDTKQASGVNYIVLDLEHGQSPKKASQGTTDSVFISSPGEEHENRIDKTSCKFDDNSKILEIGNIEDNSRKIINTSLGYSTIDFIKTCALIKSSTYGSDFDQEESRITRHSKCVRKAFSISE